MMESARVLLIQARVAGDPMAQHELECFAARSGLAPEQFRILNAAVDDVSELALARSLTTLLAEVDMVMVGGSGDFSLVTGGFDWHQPFLKIMQTLVNQRVPTFASCFGFQALVQGLGGKLCADPGCAELGTSRLDLSADGRLDPLFGRLPTSFDVQLGHNDSAVVLPDALVHLGGTERCAFQAVRVKGAPIVATQFHPELDMDGNLQRFLTYLLNYKSAEHSPDEAMKYARSVHRPSPDSSRLLRLFVEDVVGLQTDELGS